MSNAVLYMSMSVDGFIAGPNDGLDNGIGDGGDRLHEWFGMHAEGDPLVLPHGGFVDASSFFAQVPALVEAGYRVHVSERRAHAHTPDVEGPLSYSVMADDTVAHLEQEVGVRAQLFGWSDGAVVALLVAGRRDTDRVCP
jgi:pimeloyl-ACP methyl ester carboxylesterase